MQKSWETLLEEAKKDSLTNFTSNRELKKLYSSLSDYVSIENIVFTFVGFHNYKSFWSHDGNALYAVADDYLFVFNKKKVYKYDMNKYIKNTLTKKKTSKKLTLFFKEGELSIDIDGTDVQKIVNFFNNKIFNKHKKKSVVTRNETKNIVPVKVKNELSKINSDKLPKIEQKSTSIAPSNWYVTISFGKSTSSNFNKAVFLAKASDKYIKDIGEDGKPIYQANYTASHYLNFIQLYELIGNWKSCFVIMNGNIMDRKIIGGLNYCYGDKLRSGNKYFCFGASEMTANPFGCHRLQISSYNNPWWGFGKYNNLGQWIIDKQAIKERIKEKSLPYLQCPCFNLENCLKVANRLPDVIDPNKDKKAWKFLSNNVEPFEIYNKNNIAINIKIE